METPHPAGGLSLTLSWHASGERRQHVLPLDAPARTALAFLLCGAGYAFGRWTERVESSSAAPSAVVLVPRAEKAPRSGGTGVAPGRPVDEPADVITPLNVRDPSSLIMGPGALEPAPSRVPSASPPAPSSSDDIPDVEPPPRIYKHLKDIKPNERF
jgi:hypothetical protein